MIAEDGAADRVPGQCGRSWALSAVIRVDEEVIVVEGASAVRLGGHGGGAPRLAAQQKELLPESGD